MVGENVTGGVILRPQSKEQYREGKGLISEK